MFEWRVTVRCPVRPVQAERAAGAVDHQRAVYVWTEHESAVDAYDEALRVLHGWPAGSRPVDVVPVGMYVPVLGAAGDLPLLPAGDGVPARLPGSGSPSVERSVGSGGRGV